MDVRQPDALRRRACVSVSSLAPRVARQGQYAPGDIVSLVATMIL
jgi:hypothetical protein